MCYFQITIGTVIVNYVFKLYLQVRNYDYSSQISSKKKVEVALQEAIINGNMKDVEDLINNGMKII